MNAIALSLMLLLTPGATPERQELAGVSFEAPLEAEVTSKTLREGVEVIAVTRGDEVMLITVYSGKGRPSADKARAVHLEELERRLAETAVPGSLEAKKIRLSLFRRWRPAHEVHFRRKVGQEERRETAQLGAAVRRGKTIVVSWMAPRRGIVQAFSPGLIKSLKVPRSR